MSQQKQSDPNGDPEFEERRQALKSLLREKQTKWSEKKSNNARLHGALVVLAIVLSASITIAGGIFELAKLSGFLGILLSATLGLSEAWPLNEKSFFYRVGAAEAFELNLFLDRFRLSQAELADIRAKVGALEKRMASEIPRGSAVQDIVLAMREEIRTAKAAL